MPEHEEILTPEEAAGFLHLTKDQLYNLTRSSRRKQPLPPIPVCRLGKVLRFRKTSLVAWLTALENSRG